MDLNKEVIFIQEQPLLEKNKINYLINFKRSEKLIQLAKKLFDCLNKKKNIFNFFLVNVSTHQKRS